MTSLLRLIKKATELADPNMEIKRGRPRTLAIDAPMKSPAYYREYRALRKKK